MNDLCELLGLNEHVNDAADTKEKKLQLYSANLLHDIIVDGNYASNKYCKKSKGFKHLCDDIRANIPKSIYKENASGIPIDPKHKKLTLLHVYLHAMECALKKLGF